VAVKTAHVKPGKGGAFAQVELKNLIDGRKLNERFRSSDTVERVTLEQKAFQYLYEQGDALVFGLGGSPDVLLAGHSDTVPEQGNLPGRLADGFLHGLGAADMKGALAVMLALYHRDACGGRGQVIDLSLLEPLLGILGPGPSVYDQLGIIAGRHGNRSPSNAPRKASIAVWGISTDSVVSAIMPIGLR